MNSLLLWSVGRLGSLWRGLGADPRALRLILETKLKVGDRSLKMPGRTQEKATDFSVLIYFFLFLFGCLLAFVYLGSTDPATGIGLGLTAIGIYVAFMLVIEMADTLFDRRDLSLLYSRPVNDATLSLSRGLYILLFASKFVLPLSVPVALAVVYRQPLFFPLYLLIVLLLTITVVGLTMGVYLTMLRRMPPENLRRNLNYAQIGFTTIIIALYQLPNLLNLTGSGGWLLERQLAGSGWGFLGPGFWLAGLWDTVSHPLARPMSLAQAVLGVGVAAWSVGFFVRQGRNYGAQMMAMHIQGSGGATPKEESVTASRFDVYRDFLARWFTRPGPERGSFRFNWAMMGRDFSYKQQVYPLFILMVVGAVVLVVRILRTPQPVDLGSGFTIIALYVFGFFLLTPLLAARQSDNFRAGWVLHTNPLRSRKPILYGQLVAVLGQVYAVAGALVYGFVLVFAGLDMLDDVALSAAATLIIATTFQLSEQTLPFSAEKKSGSFSAFGPMLLAGVLGGISGLMHYGLTFIPYGVLAGNVFVWIVCLATCKALRG